MAAFIFTLLVIFTGAVAVPVAVLFIEIAAAVTLRDRALRSFSPHPRGSIVVLVPAHNESTGLLPTLTDIKRQLHGGDRLVVVADNCSDDTAMVAAAAGAEVVQRVDPTNVGKGYALDWGVRFLKRNPPDFVVMLDADCRLSEGAIEELVASCALTGRPAQALDLMTAPSEPRLEQKVAEFAWRVRNWVRPLGLAAFGLPCQLFGTGMAFSWKVISGADIATGSLVEDLKLGLDLTRVGHPPLFCPSACVTSQFPASTRSASIQRSRWERGHLATMLRVPRLLFSAVVHRDTNLLALTLDFAVPPLSLLAIVLVLTFAASVLARLSGFSPAAMILSASELLGLLVAVASAWTKYGRDVLPANELLLIPRYVFGKLGLYRQILLGRAAARWIRTDRSKS